MSPEEIKQARVTLKCTARELSAALDAGQPAPVTGLTELARFGLGRPGPLGDAGRAGELLAMVRDRQRKLVGQVVPGGGPAVPVPGAPGPPIQLPTLVPPPPDERVLLLLGHRLPLLAAFEISAGGAIPDPALATADRLDEWLDAVGRVRPKLGRLTHAGLLSTALGAGGLSLIAAQYPAAPGGTWAAVARPAANGNMLCVTAVTGAAPVDVTAPVCAMVVDQWVEHVPNADQVTGVAVHFDAPTNQAPQVCVLQVLPDGARWSLEVVEDAVRSTLDWARLRAVAPEDLAVDGRTVPSVYVPGSITPLATTPAAGSRAAARGNGSAAGRGAQP